MSSNSIKTNREKNERLDLGMNCDFVIVISGLVTIPIQNAKVSSVKSSDSVMTKTIQLTSAQMVK